MFYQRSVYDAVRCPWKINRDRVERYKLVLAHVSGLVVGSFRPPNGGLPPSRIFPVWKDIQICRSDGDLWGKKPKLQHGTITWGKECQKGTEGRARNLQFDTAIRNLNKS